MLTSQGWGMYRYVSKVAVIFGEHVFEGTSIQVDNNGVIVTIERSALNTIVEANGGREANADVIVKFHQTMNRKYMLEGHVYEGKVVTAYWSGQDQCQMLIDFVELSPLQQYALHLFLEEIRGACAMAS